MAMDDAGEIISFSERCPNFQQSEITRLKALLKKHEHVIFMRKSDAVTNQTKDATWNKIAEEFNKSATIKRTAKQLKSKFDNMKRTARRELSGQLRRESTNSKQSEKSTTAADRSDSVDWMTDKHKLSMDEMDSIYDETSNPPIARSTLLHPKVELKTGVEIVYPESLGNDDDNVQDREQDNMDEATDGLPLAKLLRGSSTNSGRVQQQMLDNSAKYRSTDACLAKLRMQQEKLKLEFLKKIHQEQLQQEHYKRLAESYRAKQEKIKLQLLKFKLKNNGHRTTGSSDSE